MIQKYLSVIDTCCACEQKKCPLLQMENDNIVCAECCRIIYPDAKLDTKQLNQAKYPIKFAALFQYRRGNQAFVYAHPVLYKLFQVLDAGEDFHPDLIARFWRIVKHKNDRWRRHILWFDANPDGVAKSDLLSRLHKIYYFDDRFPTEDQMNVVENFIRQY